MALGPRQYRRFVRLSDRVLDLLPWLWFGGFLAMIATMVLPPDVADMALKVVCSLTIYPFIIGWFGLSGLQILWRFALEVRSPKRRTAALASGFSLAALATGLVFFSIAVLLGGMLTAKTLAWLGRAISG